MPYKTNPDTSSLAKRNELKSSVVNFHINLDNLQHQYFRKGKIDREKINKDLEELSSIFLHVEQSLKKTP